MAASQTIVNHVIAYFAWRFDRRPSDFDRATKVRSAFKNAAAWRALADTFNQRPWVKALGVVLEQDDMNPIKTIGELANLIASKAGPSAGALSEVRFVRRPLKKWPL